MKARRSAPAALVALLALLVVAFAFGASGAAEGSNETFRAKIGKARGGTDTLLVEPAKRNYPLRVGKRVIRPGKLAKLRKQMLRRNRASFRLTAHTPVVGETRNWVGLDDVVGSFYRKTYTLRGIGRNVEVWVASEDRTFAGVRSVNTDFQVGDCRNGARTTITDAQVNYLVGEFDNNILPKESAAFSIAPNRDGSHALLGAPFHPGGKGDNTVVLVDNVRDDNFHDFNNTQGHSYIAGFFSGQLNDLFDRNIMSIDAFDWLHRTAASPTHEPSSNLCTSAPARPFLYEGVFAHEYQHLLESYASPGEATWVNEGLADWAISLTGYGDPAKPITEIGFDSHIQCFLGNLGIITNANPIGRNGGPENSLTSWQDQGDDEILCDYGAAYTFTEFLHSKYGTAFMSALHNEDLNGIPGLQKVLNDFRTGATARRLFHDWAMMVAIDGLLDQHRQLRGGTASRYQVPNLNATVNWGNPDAYSEPGAPPNGSDYVQLRDAAGNPLKLNDIKSLSFDGTSSHAPKPIEWTVDANPPGHTGNPALYSGSGNLFDRAIVRSVTVPAADPNLRFNAQWNHGDGWDFTFVQVSTNGGATYQSVRCTDSRPTTTEDPATYPALPNIRVHFPGFTGYSGGWKAETCNLAAYSGQTILVSFRNMTDPNTLGATDAIPSGFWLDDVSLGTQSLSDGSTLTGWMSATQARPIAVEGFTVQLVAYKQAGTSPVRIATLPLNGNFDATVNGRKLGGLLGQGNNADVIGAIVMYDESTEAISDYARYALRVNGVLQPGG